jgi:dUTP pyrophosphatase
MEIIMTTLGIYKTHPDIVLPKFGTSKSACFDLAFQGAGKNVYEGYARTGKKINRVMNNTIFINPGDRILVPTGLIFDIPEGFSLRVHARSGLSLKSGLVLANAEGIIDHDYVEETFVMLHNITDNMLTVCNGDRIAQAELVKVEEYSLAETPVRPAQKTEKAGGLGSTGIQHTLPETPAAPVKRGRGRPRKHPLPSPGVPYAEIDTSAGNTQTG